MDILDKIAGLMEQRNELLKINQQLGLEKEVALEEVDRLTKVNNKIIKKLKKKLMEFKVKELEFKNKKEIDKAIMFNTLYCLLEQVYNEVKE